MVRNRINKLLRLSSRLLTELFGADPWGWRARRARYSAASASSPPPSSRERRARARTGLRNSPV